MCEFCTKHGEGQKWYLQMKNYSRELRTARLTPVQRLASGFSTREGWLNSFFGSFVMPPETRPAPTTAPNPAPPKRRVTDRAITRHAMIVHFGQVLPIADVEQVLDRVTSITRVPCGCRIMTTGKADKRYCFGLGYDPFGVMGRYPDPSSSLEVIDRETAKKAFRDLDRAGLIHSIWTGVTPYVIGLCNCDRDCMAYRTSIAQNGPAVFFRAEYVAQVDVNLCTGCKSCMKQCQFGAQFYSHALGKVYIDPRRCFGCGVCMAPCPKDAIRLTPRKEHEAAKNLWLKG